MFKPQEGEYPVNLLRYLQVPVIDEEKQEQILFQILDDNFPENYLDMILMYFSLGHTPKEIEEALGMKRVNDKIGSFRRRIWRKPEWMQELSLEADLQQTQVVHPSDYYYGDGEAPEDEDPIDGLLISVGKHYHEDEGLLIRSLQKVVVDNALEALNARERLVIDYLFFQQLKMSEIAEKMGVTRSRIQQISAKALRKMKNKIELNTPGEMLLDILNF